MDKNSVDWGSMGKQFQQFLPMFILQALGMQPPPRLAHMKYQPRPYSFRSESDIFGPGPRSVRSGGKVYRGFRKPPRGGLRAAHEYAKFRSGMSRPQRLPVLIDPK